MIRGATIRDVAKRAGVSVSTASLALNGKPGVSAETRARVLRAALELDYHPHTAAKNLADGRTRTIGLIAPISLEHLFSSASFFMKLFRGLHHIAQRKGYVLSLYIAESDDEAALQIKSLVRSRAVDGLVITNPTFTSPYLEEIRRYRVPFVVIGRPVGKAPFVDNDNQAVGWMATRHLIEHGHKRIAFISGPDRFTFCQDRLLGYRKALEEAGVPYSGELVWRSEIVEEDACRVVKENFPKIRFTALLAATDVQAVGAIRALKEMGIKVPRDISVVCVNESELARHFMPSLTTVDLHERELGRRAMELLIQMIEDGVVREKGIYVEASLIIRESCGCNYGKGGGNEKEQGASQKKSGKG